MLTAHWLLLLDMNETNPGLQIPAKTVHPRLPPDPGADGAGSSTERVLALSGIPHACIDFGATPERFDAEILTFLRRPFSDAAPNAQFWSEFDTCRQTAALSALMDRMQRTPAPLPAQAGLQVVMGSQTA